MNGSYPNPFNFVRFRVYAFDDKGSVVQEITVEMVQDFLITNN
jgi:hypothetical protein